MALTLAPGSRLGVYEILSALGAGGMGEVYRARDTKLGRQVALKIVPDVFASDPEHLARFEREARTLASLNHPHIAHLHGFEDFPSTGPGQAGIRAIVMELVEGEDLAVRLTRGPIPLDEALTLAKQIVQALDTAHEQGIVHRDLKPANIKIRNDGTVKVLDFGLARAFAPAEAGAAAGQPGPGGNPANSPTITTPAMTMRGVILGTAAYMAPEQAKGKTVDSRADIWAFGCVLYEMVTGHRAFAGDDVSDTLASVLRADVDWTAVPPSLVRLLKKCLQRDPKQRLHDIGDAWDLIDAAPVVAPPVQNRRGWLAWTLAALLAATTIGLAVVHFVEAPPAGEVVRFQLPPPPSHTFHAFPSFLPDGRRFLHFRQSNSPEAQGFYVGSLDLAPDKQPLTRVVAATLGPAHVVRSTAGTERLLFLRGSTLTVQAFDPERLAVVGDATPVVEHVGSSGSFGFFTASPNDVLVYRTGVPTFTNFDRMTWLDRRGRPIGTVGEARAYSIPARSIALAPDASGAAVGVSPTPAGDLWVVEFARGTSSRFTFHEAPDMNPVWSPDGRLLVFRSNRQGQGDLYVKEVSGVSEEIPLTQTPEPETPTDWSPDGRFVLFDRLGPKSGVDLWILAPDGDRAPVSVLATPFNEMAARFSPDGRWIAYQSDESGRNEIYIRALAWSAEGKPSGGAKWLVSTDGGADVRWRRDGRELFYRHPSGAMMATDVSYRAETAHTNSPRQLFALAPTVVNWDVAPDGQRILALLPVAPRTSDPISVVLNWSRALRP